MFSASMMRSRPYTGTSSHLKYHFKYVGTMFLYIVLPIFVLTALMQLTDTDNK